VVSVDRSSMESYSAGFGSNFCVECKDDADNWIKAGCDAGVIIGSTAVMALSGGLAAPVALFTIGAGGTACSKLASNAGRWPQNQF